jgi:8-oxo-dGTP pyrophosphatase MutT (NUDIX family)
MSMIKWIEGVVPVGLEIRQVYGFIFSADGRVVVLEDEGNFNLPGGKPENVESADETLAREALEEVQTKISFREYLGYQLVEEIETYAQVRLVASIDHFLPGEKDPSTGTPITTF